MFSLLLLLACSDNPSMKGRVVDIWNQPVEGATVIGAGERPLTDAFGVYELPNLAPGSYEMKAGKEGYVQDEATFEVTAETKTGPTFRLYKKPAKTGFYAVTVGDYRAIEPATVKHKGHASDAIYGIEAPNERVFVEGGDVRIVYHIDLSVAQIKALGLKLRRLTLLEETEMASVAGGQKTRVPINLFVDDGAVALDITPLNSKGYYLLQPTEPLTAGVYALESQDLLKPRDADTWNRIPESLRTVYPLTIK